MKKKTSKYKQLLATGLAVAGVAQAGAVKANAATWNILGPSVEGGVNTGTVISAEENKAYHEKHTNKELGIWIHHTKDSKTIQSESDKNREIVSNLGDSTQRTFSRYTNEKGEPFTGLYLSRNSETGAPIEWMVLDKDGCYRRDVNLPQFAWLNGRLSADFLLNTEGLNYNSVNKRFYLTKTDYSNGMFSYIAFNEWQKTRDGDWYRSNAEGIAYQNEWFKDTDGKWYYFGNDCKMVRNKLVNGYWIGEDGVWVK